MNFMLDAIQMAGIVLPVIFLIRSSGKENGKRMISFFVLLFFSVFFFLRQANVIDPEWPFSTPTPTSSVYPYTDPTPTPTPTLCTLTSAPTISPSSLEITSIKNVGRAIELKWTDLGDGVEYIVYRRWGKAQSIEFVEIAKVKTNYYKDYHKESQNGYTYYYCIGVADEKGNEYASPKRGINFVY